MRRKGKGIARVSRFWYKKNQAKQIRAGQIKLVQRLADITEKFAVGGLLIGFFSERRDDDCRYRTFVPSGFTPFIMENAPC